MSDPIVLADVLADLDGSLDLTAFAAQRSARLTIADADISPYVRDDLVKDNWDDTVNAASQLWLDVYNELAPDAYPQKALEEFQRELTASLEKTKIGDDGPDQAQLDRITKYVGTATVNDATTSAAFAAGGRQKRWVSMHDGDVRGSHQRADGQIALINGSFDVGGARLRYPGDPTGPVEEVINCRCYVAPVGRLARRNTMAAAATEIAIEDDLETEETEIEDQALVDDDLDIPWHAVLAPEEQPTGDGRMFAKDSVSWRNLPLPLLYQHETGVSHAGSVRVGRIDEIWKEEGSSQIRARGVFNRTPEAQQAIEGITDGSGRGVSVDVDDMELDFDRSTENIEDAYGGTMVFSKARVAGLTIVAIPAYQEAYIALGEAFDDELSEEDHAALAACGCDQALELEELPVAAELTAAAGTKDGPGWITNPRSTARIRNYWTQGKGAAKIRWGEPGDFNRCRTQLAKYVRNPEWLAGTCANMHREALGLWPGTERGGRHSNLTVVPAVTLAASASAATAPTVVSASVFADPGLQGPTPLTVSTDRVYGHLATWGVCHIGINDVCTTAPHSASNYAYFRTGVVETDEGPVAVGHITMATGHASLGQTAAAAAAHYDNTGAVVADIAAGEDAYGIWISGRIRPGADVERIMELSAAALSGDWREIGGRLELVAALAVNVPGFPIPRIGLAASAANGQTSTRALVAAGVVTAAADQDDRTAAIARTAVQEYVALLAEQAAAEERARRFGPVREQVRNLRVAAVRKGTN